MQQLIFSLVLSTLLLATACQTATDKGSAQQNANDIEKAMGLDGEGVNLQRQALATHDEAMKQMSVIAQYRSKISEAAADPKADTKALKALEKQLGDADQAMLDWMHHFKKPANPEDSISYLTTQKTAIARIQQQMNDAVLAAQKQFGDTKEK